MAGQGANEKFREDQFGQGIGQGDQGVQKNGRGSH